MSGDAFTFSESYWGRRWSRRLVAVLGDSAAINWFVWGMGQLGGPA